MHNALQEWQAEDSVHAVCFATATSNARRSAGACIILEQPLGEHLLYFSCRYHILEIILGTTFQECLDLAGAPEIFPFKLFQAQ